MSRPSTASATPDPKKKGKKGAPSKSETTPAAPPPPPRRQTESFGGLGKLRVALLPVLPFLFKIHRPPTLPHPLLEPYNHPSYPLRILSSADSPYSGVVVVGELTAADTDEQRGTEHLRYLRAGHSLLGGVWVGPKAHALDPRLLLVDEAGDKLGDTIYTAFIIQEAALLAKEDPKNALIMYVPDEHRFFRCKAL